MGLFKILRAAAVHNNKSVGGREGGRRGGGGEEEGRWSGASRIVCLRNGLSKDGRGVPVC